MGAPDLYRLPHSHRYVLGLIPNIMYRKSSILSSLIKYVSKLLTKEHLFLFFIYLKMRQPLRRNRPQVSHQLFTEPFHKICRLSFTQDILHHRVQALSQSLGLQRPRDYPIAVILEVELDQGAPLDRLNQRQPKHVLHRCNGTDCKTAKTNFLLQC